MWLIVLTLEQNLIIVMLNWHVHAVYVAFLNTCINFKKCGLCSCILKTHQFFSNLHHVFSVSGLSDRAIS